MPLRNGFGKSANGRGLLRGASTSTASSASPSLLDHQPNNACHHASRAASKLLAQDVKLARKRRTARSRKKAATTARTANTIHLRTGPSQWKIEDKNDERPPRGEGGGLPAWEDGCPCCPLG